MAVNTRIVDPKEANLLAFSVRADYVFDRDKWNYKTDVSALLDNIK